MSYPNIARQSATLQNRLHNLLIIKRNFKQLASNSITTVQELRHRATNYDSIRKAEILTKFVDDLTDYNYSLEYLQTFVKDITNSTIANKLIELNRLKESEFQAKLSECSSECESLRTEMAHLDLLIKELRAEREADRLRLEQLENKVSTLEAEVSTLETEVFTLEAEVSTLHSQNLELGDKVSTLTEENVEQYELIEEQDSKINVLSVNVTELISALKAESNERVNALTKANTQWRAILKAELEENNRQWELKLERQTEFFKAEIAEVRGRLDNLEAQMRAMRTDTDALKDKVDTLANPISVEDRQQINRDLANLVALSYSTVANLQLVDPTYEQRQHWFVLLKEVFKLTKTLPRFGFNVKQHLSFIQLMFKTNPC